MGQKEVHGKCWCGAVQLVLRREPKIQAYCLCSECQRNFGAVMRPSVLVQVDKVDGLDVGDACEVKPTNKLLKHNVKKGGEITSVRHFCNTCGCPVINTKPGPKMVSISATLLEDFEFRPQFHMFCDSTTLSRTAASTYKDGLPKYAETPREMGGSGKLFES